MPIGRPPDERKADAKVTGTLKPRVTNCDAGLTNYMKRRLGRQQSIYEILSSKRRSYNITKFSLLLLAHFWQRLRQPSLSHNATLSTQQYIV